LISDLPITEVTFTSFFVSRQNKRINRLNSQAIYRSIASNRHSSNYSLYDMSDLVNVCLKSPKTDPQASLIPKFQGLIPPDSRYWKRGADRKDEGGKRGGMLRHDCQGMDGPANLIWY